MTDTEHAPFPTDWTDWREVWRGWQASQAAAGRMRRSDYRFPPPNFMADEVLGVWHIAGRHVELSEVTFPDLSTGSGRRRRYVGVTFAGGDGGSTESGGLVETFEELERVLYGDDEDGGDDE